MAMNGSLSLEDIEIHSMLGLTFAQDILNLVFRFVCTPLSENLVPGINIIVEILQPFHFGKTSSLITAFQVSLFEGIHRCE